MSKLKKLNKLNKSKTLNVALAVGLVASNLVSVVPAFAATPASAHIMSVSNRISMTSTMVNTLDPQDVTVEITTGNPLTGIKLGSSYLEADTDYTVDGDQVTILASYLEGLSTGSKSFKFDFDGGSDKTLRISISDKEASISSRYATFNNKNGRGKDISVTVKTYGLTLNQILNDGDALDTEDYEVGAPSSSGYVKVKILKEYLSTLPNETNDLTFEFSGGEAPVLPVRVSYNDEVQEATLKSVSAVNGIVTATLTSVPDEIGDFVVTQSINGAAATTVTPTLVMNGAVATLTVAPVVATTADQSVVYSVSYKGGVAKVASAFTVPASAEVALTVSSVSAINGTQVKVTLNHAPAATDALTYTFAGTAVAAANVSVTGAEVTLTVPAMTDTTNGTTPAYAVVVMNGATILSTSSVVYDINQITTLAFVSTDFNKQIGNEITVKAKLTDEDGDAIVNKVVKLESAPWASGFETAKTLTATTDATGIATFAWTANHDGFEPFTIYSADRSVVRLGGNITWVVAANLVNLDSNAMTNQSLSDESAFEFTVTAKNANNSNYTGNLNFALNVNDSTPGTNSLLDALGNANIKVQVWNGTAWANGINTVTPAAGALGEATATTFVYNMQTADDATKKFRIYTKDETLLASAVDKLVVTAWYDADASASLTAQDPRAVTGSKTFVAGAPVITLTAKSDVNTIATAAASADGKESKLYDLTVKDQFGNPYKGTVLAREAAAADNSALTVATTNWQFAFDTNADNTFDVANSNTPTYNTRIGQNDLNDDSIAVLRVQDATTAETVTPVVLVDIANPIGAADVAGTIDANDVSAQGAAVVTSQVRAISSFTTTPAFTSNPAAGGTAQWSVAVLDQFGTALTSYAGNEDLEIELLDSNGVAVTANNAAGPDLYVDLGGGTTFASDFDTTLQNAPVLVGLRDQNITANNFTFQLRNGAAATSYQLRVYRDVNDGDTFQPDEPNTVATVSFATAVLSNGVLTGGIANAQTFDGANAADAATASQATGAQYVAPYNALNVATIRYNLQDQSGQAFVTGASNPVTISWTVKNNGTVDATINNGTANTLAAGATATYTTTVAAGGNSNTSIAITPSVAGSTFDVTAQIEGNAASLKTTQVTYLSEAAITADPAATRTIIGTLVGIQKDGNDDGTVANNDGTVYVVKTSLGQYIAVQVAAGDYANMTAGSIDGNTGITEAIAEGTLANVGIGNTIRVVLGGDTAAYDADDVISIRF